MVGSRRYFQYSSDNGNTYAVELDESNYENTDLGFGPIDTGATGPLAQGRILQANATRPLKMRRINLRGTGGNLGITRTLWCGAANAPLFTGAATQITLAGVTFAVTSTRGEERAGIPATDTGQTDGDIDDNFVTA